MEKTGIADGKRISGNLTDVDCRRLGAKRRGGEGSEGGEGPPRPEVRDTVIVSSSQVDSVLERL